MNEADIKTLRTLIEDHQRVGEMVDALQPIFGDTFEGEFFTRMFAVLDNYTATVAEFLGDESDCIEWFIQDCGCGKTPQKCILGGEKEWHTIATIDDLIKLLDDEKEAGK